jgi:preprotein translocase subunit SecE
MAKQATVPAGRGGQRVPSLPQYIQESRAELRKVVWPSREETLQLTGAVITMVVAIAAFLYFFDNVLTTIIQHLTGV